MGGSLIFDNADPAGALGTCRGAFAAATLSCVHRTGKRLSSGFRRLKAFESQPGVTQFPHESTGPQLQLECPTFGSGIDAPGMHFTPSTHWPSELR